MRKIKIRTIKKKDVWGRTHKEQVVDLIGLERIQIHEILEKLAFSLQRKHERNIGFKFGDIKEHPIYEIVIELRKYFKDNYGLSIIVDNILRGINLSPNEYPGAKIMRPYKSSNTTNIKDEYNKEMQTFNLEDE